MIGKTLGAWLKEFITLVMVQTIQAFIYAIIIVLIVAINSKSAASIGNPDDANGAIGVLAVVALTSVFKVEALVKKIFGIGETKASIKGAMGSIAKTAIALKMGQRVLDNTVKGSKGIAQKAKARGDMRKANTNMDKDTNELGKSNNRADENYNNAEQTAEQKYNAKIEEIESGNDSPEKKAALKKQAEADMNAAKQKAAQIREDRKEAIKKQYKTIKDNYESKMEEIKKSNREGTKMIYSSGVETVGAAYGGVAGAIIGGAHGDLAEAGQGLLAGMGVGDAIGQTAVNTVANSVEFTNNVAKYNEKYFKDINKRVEHMRNMGERGSKLNAMLERQKDGLWANEKRIKERLKEIDNTVDNI